AQEKEIVRLKERVQVLKDRESVAAKQSGDDAPIKGRIGPTASPIITRRKGKEVLVESDTLKKKKLQERIDAQVAKEERSNLEKEQVKKQKSSKEAPEIETSTEDFTEEKIKEMMQLVPYKFPLPVKIVATTRRKEMPLSEVCTAIEEKKKKLPVKDRWQLH
nr:hypothetical protein [Tanacetum cinerariifolium]